MVLLQGQGSIGKMSELYGCNGFKFRTTPPDYDFDFHVAPARQLVVNLDCDCEISVSDGENRVVKAGSVFFLEVSNKEADHSTILHLCYSAPLHDQQRWALQVLWDSIVVG